MKKLNLKELKQCFFVGSSIGNDDHRFEDGEENNRMWCAMLEALEESNRILNHFTGAEGWLGNRARNYMKRFEDE